MSTVLRFNIGKITKFFEPAKFLTKKCGPTEVSPQQKPINMNTKSIQTQYTSEQIKECFVNHRHILRVEVNNLKSFVNYSVYHRYVQCIVHNYYIPFGRWFYAVYSNVPPLN